MTIRLFRRVGFVLLSIPIGKHLDILLSMGAKKKGKRNRTRRCCVLLVRATPYLSANHHHLPHRQWFFYPFQLSSNPSITYHCVWAELGSSPSNYLRQETRIARSCDMQTEPQNHHHQPAAQLGTDSGGSHERCSLTPLLFEVRRDRACFCSNTFHTFTNIHQRNVRRSTITANWTGRVWPF